MEKIKIECPECKGTGLYKGMAERDGCAVICNKCAGTGFVYFHYNEFTEKKKRNDVKRVFERTCGYVHSAENVVCDDGKELHFANYGCTYEEWLNGETPKPMEELYCPFIYYNKGYGSEPLPKCNIDLGQRISDCKFYSDKANCWKEYHEKNKHIIKRIDG